jgi:hypothetical protein
MGIWLNIKVLAKEHAPCVKSVNQNQPHEEFDSIRAVRLPEQTECRGRIKIGKHHLIVAP